jgi:hypothetical protein
MFICINIKNNKAKITDNIPAYKPKLAYVKNILCRSY